MNKKQILLISIVILLLVVSCKSTQNIKETKVSSLGKEKIYFVGRPYSDNPEAIIYSVNFDGSDLGPVADLKGWRPRLSPDGKKLLWSPDDFITSIYNFETGEETVLLDEEPFNWDPEWSPDGSRIAFASRRDGYFDIWTMKSDGTDLKNLTNTPEVGEWDPRWNSNGKIYFGRNMVNDVGWERVPEIFSEQIQLFSMDSEGGNETQLTEGDGWNANHSFSYDDQWILNGQFEWVYIIDLNGENRKNLLTFEGSGFDQFMGHVLSKDMKYIVLSGLMHGDKHFYLYSYNIETGDYKRITDQDYMEEWFPEF